MIGELAELYQEQPRNLNPVMSPFCWLETDDVKNYKVSDVLTNLFNIRQYSCSRTQVSIRGGFITCTSTLETIPIT